MIQNIADPGGAGQAFYLEMPPLIVNGRPFINSSPRLFPPLSDYACVNQPFYFDFSGTDADGDSLVYFLEIPLNGNSTRGNPLPNASSGPYSQVLMLHGYNNVNNLIRGNPSLNIGRQTGQLTLTPSEPGLFVFAVKCEEYRDGIKIGEVRRDFQLMVLDCPLANPPTAGFDTDGQRVSRKQEKLAFKAEQAGNCFKVYATDADPGTVYTTRIIPQSHPGVNAVSVTAPTRSYAAGDIAEFDLCLDNCPGIYNGTYEFLLLIGDNSCSLPLFDTVQVSIDITLENNPPRVFTGLAFDDERRAYYGEVKIGEQLRFTAIGEDDDLDSLVLRAIGKGFQLAPANVTAPLVRGRGRVTTDFDWTPDCSQVDLATAEGEVVFQLIVEDYWECGLKSSDTVDVVIRVFFEPENNNPPNIAIDGMQLQGQRKVYRQTLTVGDSLEILVTGDDPDGDLLTLALLRRSGIRGGELPPGASFNDISGLPPLESLFSFWSDCSMLGRSFADTVLTFEFLLRDNSGCGPTSVDTVVLEIELKDIQQPVVAAFPNAFSPNGDGIGEAYRITNLPPDDCKGVFEHVAIYNRWGQEVFFSEERSFAWDGKNHPAGTYFYLVKYSDRVYKGSVTLFTGNIPQFGGN